MLAPLTWDGLNRLDALFSLRVLREHLSILVQCCTNLYHLISAGVKFRVSAKVVTRLKSRKSSYQEKQVRMCFPDAAGSRGWWSSRPWLGVAPKRFFHINQAAAAEFIQRTWKNVDQEEALFEINVQIFQDGQAQGISHRFTRSLVNFEKEALPRSLIGICIYI